GATMPFDAYAMLCGVLDDPRLQGGRTVPDLLESELLWAVSEPRYAACLDRLLSLASPNEPGPGVCQAVLAEVTSARERGEDEARIRARLGLLRPFFERARPHAGGRLRLRRRARAGRRLWTRCGGRVRATHAGGPGCAPLPRRARWGRGRRSSDSRASGTRL